MTDIAILKTAPLFRGLTAKDIEQVVSSVTLRIRKYKAGVLIFHTGDPVDFFIMLISGRVKGEMTDYAGRVIKIEDVSAPGSIAAAFLFGRNNRFPVNVAALTDTSLLMIEKKAFLRILKSNDVVLVNFLDMISNRSQFLSEKIKFLNFKTIREKLAQFILQQTTETKPEFDLDRTQKDLADFFGVARPSIARALGELEHDGLIMSKGKNIRVIDKKRLADLTGD